MHWGVGVSAFLGKNVTKVRYKHYEGMVGVNFPGKKRCVTLEWPLIIC